MQYSPFLKDIKGVRKKAMNNKTAQELNNSINKISYQLLKLKNSIETCDKSNKIYNKLLIQRACIRRKLKSMQSRNFLSFIFTRFQKKPKQKLISDYFK